MTSQQIISSLLGALTTIAIALGGYALSTIGDFKAEIAVLRSQLDALKSDKRDRRCQKIIQELR